MSQAICDICGSRGTVNNQLPICKREDCPSTGFARAMKPFLIPAGQRIEIIEKAPAEPRKPKYWPLWKRILRRVRFWICPHWAKHGFGHGTWKCPWCGGVNNYFHRVGWKLYWHPTDTWNRGPKERKP